MAKQFTFWYSEPYTYKAWFEADSIEEARELLDQVYTADLDMEEDLPKFGNKDKDFTLDIDMVSLEEVED